MLAGGEEPSHENGTNFLSKSNFDEVVSIKDFFAPSTSSPNRNVMNIEPVVTPGHWPKGKDMVINLMDDDQVSESASLSHVVEDLAISIQGFPKAPNIVQPFVRPIKTVGKILRLHSDLNSIYEIRHGKIYLKDRSKHGYRFHHVLLENLLSLARMGSAPMEFPLETLSNVVAGLIHESPSSADISRLSEDIWQIIDEVITSCRPPSRQSGPSIKVEHGTEVFEPSKVKSKGYLVSNMAMDIPNTCNAITSEIVDSIVKDMAYLQPMSDPEWNIPCSDCHIWQVKNLNILSFMGIHVLESIQQIRIVRLKAFAKLSSFLGKSTSKSNEKAASLSSPPSVSIHLASEKGGIDNLSQMVSGDQNKCASPIKGALSSNPQTPPSVAFKSKGNALKGNAKLTSFFNIVTTKKVLLTQGNEQKQPEYFQPFFAKPDTHIAPLYPFPVPSAANNVSLGDWNEFRHRAQRHPAAKYKRRSPCLGTNSKVLYLVVKLIQFHENYRPPYFGTFRKASTQITGRRPLAQDQSVFCYNYDSDEDWGEDEDILDAESLSGSEEDEKDGEDEDEDQTLGSGASEAEDWVVPDGYISDDEGVEGGSNLGAVSRKRRTRPVDSVISSANSSKKRYVEKEPVSYSQEKLSETFGLTWLTPYAMGIYPFTFKSHNVEPVPAIEEIIRKVPFNDNLLPSLASIANESSLSVAKLYDLFAAKFEKVSRRQFDLKLNQIAFRSNSSEGNIRGQWFVRSEYIHLLSQIDLPKKGSGISIHPSDSQIN